MSSFRTRLTLQQRVDEYAQIKRRRPAHIPVIFERYKPTDPMIDREKFLVPLDLTAAQLSFVLRKRLRVDPSQAIFMFVSNRVLTGSTSIQQVYTKTQTHDGFLYVQYSLENAFGTRPK